MRTVTVVMSSFNGEKYIKEQIDSILSQKHCKVSLLVRDDGSSDATITILQQYENKGQLKLLQGENLKPAKSFLEALKYSGETDYYAFSDQDDIWLDDKLNAAINVLEKMDNNKLNLYCSNLTAVDNNYNILTSRLLPEQIVSNYKELLVRSPHIFGCTCVFNKKLRDFIVDRELPKNLIMHDLWIALIASSMGNLYYDSAAYIMYRQHGNNHTGAIMSFKEKMRTRWRDIIGASPFSISLQAKEVIAYIGDKKLEKLGLLDYSEMVANYKCSVINKIKYIKNVEHKSMSNKQFLFHILLIVMGRL